MAHIHAELMAQYAEDAKQHDKPWELWQYYVSGTWENCENHPSWFTDHHYRRKPRTVQIGDIEVPEPCKFALRYGQKYFVPDVTTGLGLRRTWAHASEDVHALKSNLVHLDTQSAALHAKALIEVSREWWK